MPPVGYDAADDPDNPKHSRHLERIQHAKDRVARDAVKVVEETDHTVGRKLKEVGPLNPKRRGKAPLKRAREDITFTNGDMSFEMVFTLTTYDVFLKDNHILVAYCYTKDGLSRRSELNLDEHIGNVDGSFHILKPSDSHFFSHTSRDITYKDGVMRASLRKLSQDYNITSVCLDLYIVNDNGCLKFRKPHSGDILSSCRTFSLTYSVLSALCLGPDGAWHASSLDLDEHYSVYEGAVVPIGTHFYRGVRNASFQFRHGEVDLTNCVFNRDGKLAFELDLSGSKPFKLM
ncbi:Cyanovirin-N [Fomitopsis serialis]|uniref:Cyanovirin-N n=1 Tax=Fomitopsis serialis TaxID=139415 RepID=UPI0020086D05|nr:Cyanovirin-N [Neoantrodia serialis]KAH9930201.1 Cyanovirin-N [Neoantrodia serialis]